MQRLFLTLVALSVLVVASCGGAVDADGEITDPFTRVVVTAGEGTIQIERTSGTPEWIAEASYSGEEPDFVPRVVEGELIVDEGCGEREGCSVDYLISVPEGTEVFARTGSGDVTITEISASVDIATESGVVFLNTVKGDILVATGSADIVGTRLEATTARFISGSGNIDVSFERVVADLAAETGSGNVTAQLAGGPYNLDVETGSGGIDLKVDDDDTATNTVVLKTGSGDLTVYEQ